MTIQINGTSGISGVDGSAATPALQGTDTNTGISFGTDEVNINTDGTTRATVDSSGRLLVGTSTAVGSSNAVIIKGTSGVSNGSIYLGNASNASTLVAGNTLGFLEFGAADGGTGAQILGVADGTWSSTSDCPTRLVFSTTADGASSPTERAKITSSGYFKATSDGTHHGSTADYHEFTSDSIYHALILRMQNASYAETGGGIFPIGCKRSNTSSYTFAGFYSGDGTGTFIDREFAVIGDGNVICEGSFSGGGADYAEMFEWVDGNPSTQDRRGISVVLDGDKIREAVAGEEPIGVISGNPSVVGDAALNKWSDKYLRDDFGTYLRDENDERYLNPDFDPDAVYVPRKDRPEWDCVGLMGKLRIRKGQVTGSRWIKMRDVSDTVEEWLVR